MIILFYFPLAERTVEWIEKATRTGCDESRCSTGTASDVRIDQS